MNKKILSVILIFMIFGITATAVYFLYPYNPLNPPLADDTGSTPEGIKEVVNANNQFAFDLYDKYKDNEENKDKNIFFSPYSISTALAMTYEGAKGETADEIKNVFHFPDDDILRPNSAAVYNQINKKDKNYELRTGNALWIQQDFNLLEDYKNRVENYYGGKAVNLDFVTETEKSRQTINNFIEEQTNDKIKDLIPEGVITPATRLVLTNAIYFKGNWEWEFDKSDTREKDFFVTKNNPIKTDMMYMDPDKAKFNYAELDKLQILEMPYKDDEISMLVILPKQGESYDYDTNEVINYGYTLDDIDFSLENLNYWKSQMKETKLDSIYFPKFEFETKYIMNDDLKEMGMPSAFSSNADFSGMTLEEQLYISSVIHQAYVKVDEKGTEAAAATAVVMEMSIAKQINVFNADHPFIFIIQEKSSGNILFMGRMNNPSSSE